MGAFSGGLTFRQYYVKDPLPADRGAWREAVAARIKSHAFKDMDPQSEEERAVGWCSPHFPLDVELEEPMYLYNEYLVLGMRIDTLSVPGPLLRIFAEAEERRVMAETKRASLNRYEKAEIKERVKGDLKRKLMPSIKVVDLVWNLDQGLVRFFGGNEKVNLEFQELFESTFELGLVPDCALTAATHGGPPLGEALEEALAKVEPGPFADADTMVAAMKEV